MTTILDQYVRTAATGVVGGTGSTKQYTIQSQQPNSPLTNLLVYTTDGTKSDSYITYLRATFADGSSGAAGQSTGCQVSFSFQDGETLEACYLYFIGSNTGFVAMSFVTNLGRSFVAGDTTSEGTQVAMSGGRIFGFFGTEGNAVDTIGLFMEIPVTDIEIYDLQYNLTGVTPTVLWPIALDTMTLSNNTSESQTASVTRSYSVTNSSNWSITGGLKVGARTKISTGIPLVVEGEVELSAEISFSFTYGRTYSSTQVFEYTAEVAVPANSQITAEVTATLGNLAVGYDGSMLICYADGVTNTISLNGTYSGLTSYAVVVTYTTPQSPAAIVAERTRQVAAAGARGKRAPLQSIAGVAG